MSNIEKKKDHYKLIKMLHSRNDNFDIAKPFQREIFLLETLVAKTSKIEGLEKIESQIQIGDKLTFLRNKDNENDRASIVVFTERNEKIGYVPKNDNIILSNLMDANKKIYGKVSDKEMRGVWLKIKMKIYLCD
ncbi:MAG: HIRAN domain-containing protein [Erysipelotrichaceae bacterium]|jgi:hypothetical protein